ncbi:hypothetical protein [Salinibacter altiplanensis]|uniref:hypothetical protein n=1 Tax=Salinibacter altiplanensis TaxID=1803181 RepID=UPI0012FFE871|nr:hypothetical protein [Salinibacter altiplanensis]
MAAAAGAAGGAAADNEDAEYLEYYLMTETMPDSIRTAMEKERLAVGMNKTQVRLVMGARPHHPGDPSSVTKEGDEELWVFKSDNRPDRVVRFDQEGTVIKLERRLI